VAGKIEQYRCPVLGQENSRSSASSPANDANLIIVLRRRRFTMLIEARVNVNPRSVYPDARVIAPRARFTLKKAA